MDGWKLGVCGSGDIWDIDIRMDGDVDIGGVWDMNVWGDMDLGILGCGDGYWDMRSVDLGYRDESAGHESTNR